MESMPPKMAEECWKIAGSVEWTVEDWQDFYQSLTAVFARIAARHAKSKVDKSCVNAAAQ